LEKHLKICDDFTNCSEILKSSYERITTTLSDITSKMEDIGSLFMILKNNFMTLGEKTKKLSFVSNSALMYDMAEHFEAVKKSYDII